MSNKENGFELPVKYHDLHWSKRRIVREQYIEEQDGSCYHCGRPLDEKPSSEIMELSVNRDLFPPNFFKHPVHLHHDHDTGLTIGAVHARCNAVLWQYHGE